MTEVSMLVHLAGLSDGGPEAVFDDLIGRAGVSGAVWGALPYEQDFWSVRNRSPRVVGAEPGAAYFQPDHGLWSGMRLRPPAAAAIGTHDLLATVCDEATRLGLPAHVRVSALRNRRLAGQHPDCAQRDVTGRPHRWGLCPSHPDARAYVTTMVQNLALYGVKTIRVDWLHFSGLPHDVSLSLGRARGSCFCRHCRIALDPWCDVDAAIHEARRVLGMEPWPEPESAGSTELDRLDCLPAPTTALDHYREAAFRPVVAIAAEAARTAGAYGMRVCVTGPPRRSRRDTGLDRALISQAVGCFQSPATVIRRHTRAYTDPAGSGTVCLRPETDHWTSSDDPGPSISHARRGGMAEIEFQHYHAMPDAYLDRIADVHAFGDAATSS